MFRVQLKTITPTGAIRPQMIPGYTEAFAELSAVVNAHLAAEPTFETNGDAAIRIDQISSLESVRAKHIATNVWGIQHGVAAHRTQYGISRYIKIEDTDTNQVVLDWTQIPELDASEFVAWINETIV